MTRTLGYTGLIISLLWGAIMMVRSLHPKANNKFTAISCAALYIAMIVVLAISLLGEVY